MRKKTYTLLLILSVSLFLPAQIYAQIDTTLKDFFPLHIGDYWEYLDEDFPQPTLHYFVRIKRDTVMPNSKRYFAFNEVEFRFPSDSDRYYNYYRMDDSMRVWRYYADTLSCSSSEYPIYQLAASDRSLWPVCLDWVPGSQQEYIGLYSTQQDFFPHLQLDTLSKLFRGIVYIDSTTGDTVWNNPFFYKDWLAQGVGVARAQGEAGPVVYLRGAIINGKKYGIITAIDDNGMSGNTPSQFSLWPNYPNPFNSTTTIRYTIPRNTHVSLKVYNVLGREVATIVDRVHGPGEYMASFDGSMVASGVYFYQLTSFGQIHVRKMILMK